MTRDDQRQRALELALALGQNRNYSSDLILEMAKNFDTFLQDAPQKTRRRRVTGNQPDPKQEIKVEYDDQGNYIGTPVEF
jgi:hypothetical protein